MITVVIREVTYTTVTVPDEVFDGCIAGEGWHGFTTPRREPGESPLAYVRRVSPSEASCDALGTYRIDAPETEKTISSVNGVDVL